MTKDITQDSKWLAMFLDFISFINIDSKEAGVTNLRKKLYGAQLRLLEQIDDGMREDVRHFVVLKARQLGISTISLALDLFWLMVHPGLQGALVTDTEPNREKFRILIDRYFESLPKHITGKIRIVKNNRNNLVLNNGSVLDYLVAGTKKGNAGLGRSRALNFVHATECSSWGDPESVASLQASMAEKHPDRLYIFESTAKGFNLFWDMWESALDDPKSQKAIFLGWWSKDDYALAQTDNKFGDFWDGVLTQEEEKTARQVEEEYNHIITPEQWAWYRWKCHTRISQEGMMQQEMPSTAEEAFISTGQSFFPKKRLDTDMVRIRDANLLFKAYRYHMGEDFTATTIEPVSNSWEADLRVWEGPSPFGDYIIAVDPAYGSNDNKDRHGIVVYRAFADRIVQCAEYASPNPQTYQAAWVMAHLAGWYQNTTINVEIGGPGAIIIQEMKNLRQKFDLGMQDKGTGKGLKDVFNMVRWYIYTKYDSPSGSSNLYGFQQTVNTKMQIMNQMRDAYAKGELEIRSIPLLEEMHRVVQDGSSIEAEGRAKDDRVMATALAVRAWVDRRRSDLLGRGDTYEAVMKRESDAERKPQDSIVGNVLASYYAAQELKRKQARLANLRTRPRRR